jgi:hypothetical protein
MLGQTQVPAQIGLLENFATEKHSSLFDLFACDKEKSAETERDKRSSFLGFFTGDEEKMFS